MSSLLGSGAGRFLGFGAQPGMQGGRTPYSYTPTVAPPAQASSEPSGLTYGPLYWQALLAEQKKQADAAAAEKAKQALLLQSIMTGQYADSIVNPPGSGGGAGGGGVGDAGVGGIGDIGDAGDGGGGGGGK